MTAFWDVTPRSLKGRYQRCRETCCLHFQGGKVKTEAAASSKMFLSTKLHAITSEKPGILIKRITNYQSFQIEMMQSTNWKGHVTK
jgi:hypothetical protein